MLATLDETPTADADHPDGPFAALPGPANPLALLTYDGPAGLDAVMVGQRQPIAADDVLVVGTYRKVITFTLSSTA